MINLKGVIEKMNKRIKKKLKKRGNIRKFKNYNSYITVTMTIGFIGRENRNCTLYNYIHDNFQ